MSVMLPKILRRGIVGGLIAFICVIVLTIHGPLKVLDPTPDFYWTMASISGALAEFVLVGVTILHALPDVEIYRELQQFKSFKQSYTIYYVTFMFLLVVLTLSIIGGASLPHNRIFGYLVLASFMVSLGMVYSCFWILKKLTELRFK